MLMTLSVGCLGESPVVPTVAASEAPAAPPEVSSRVVMITAAADSPQTILVWAGDRVLFVNNDRVEHEIPSDQRPSHLECLGINQAGYDGPSASIDDLRMINGEVGNFRRAANRNDFVVPYRDCLGNRERRIDGDNPATSDHQIGWAHHHAPTA